MRTFYEAMAGLTGVVTLAGLARELRRSEAAIGRALLAKDTDRRGKPPADWPCAVARLARRRMAALAELAEEMEQRCPSARAGRWRARVRKPKLRRNPSD